MDLNLISLFVDIAEASSLSDAARRMGVTRSHVSQRLQALERQMGVELMRRTTRRVELTEAGQTLYEHGTRMCREADAAVLAVGTLGRETRGLVRLSMPTGLGRLLVAPLLIAFQREHPGICLSVRLSNRIDDLVSAQIDVALKVASTLPGDLVAREIGVVGWSLCAAPSYLAGNAAIRVAGDLAAHPFLCPPQTSRQPVLKVGAQAVVVISPRVQSEDFCLLLDAIEAGLGVGLMPSYLVSDALAAGRLTCLLPGVPIENAGETLFLITMRATYRSPAQRLVVDFLRRELTNHASFRASEFRP